MGKFDTHGGFFSPQGLIQINTGGSHAKNEYGGVQMGVDPEGIPNLVEEDETIYEDYVFSDNIKADKYVLGMYHIPEKYAGMLYSEIADILCEEAEENPNDPISANGLDAMLGRLAEAQEEQKRRKEERKMRAELKKMSPEELVALGASLAQAQQAQAQPQDTMLQRPQPQPQQAMPMDPSMMQVPTAMPSEQMMPQEAVGYEDGGMVNKFDGKGKSTLKKIWDTGKYFVPGVGTYHSINDAIEDPSLKNIGFAGLSVLGDAATILVPGAAAVSSGLRAASGAAKAGRVAKAASRMAKGSLRTPSRTIAQAEKQGIKQAGIEAARKTKTTALNVEREGLTHTRQSAAGTVGRHKQLMEHWQGKYNELQTAYKNWLDKVTTSAKNGDSVALAEAKAAAQKIADEMNEVAKKLEGFSEKRYVGERTMEGAQKGISKVDKKLGKLEPTTSPAAAESAADVASTAKQAASQASTAKAASKGSDIVEKGLGYSLNPFYGFKTYASKEALKDASKARKFWTRVGAGAEAGAVGNGEGLLLIEAGKDIMDVANSGHNTRNAMNNPRNYRAYGGKVNKFGGDEKSLLRKVTKNDIINDISDEELNRLLQDNVNIGGLEDSLGTGPIFYEILDRILDENQNAVTDDARQSMYLKAVKDAYGEKPTPTPLPKIGRNAGIVGSTVEALADIGQPTDYYPMKTLRAPIVSGHMDYRNQRYVPADWNLVNSNLAAGFAGQRNDINNAGIGPGVGKTLLASNYNNNIARGNALAQTMQLGNQQRNATIAANNTGNASLAQFYANLGAQNAKMKQLFDRYNYANLLKTMQLNDAAEQAKYTAFSNNVDNAIKGITGKATQNFRMNQINSNPTLLQNATGTGYNTYRLAMKGGLLKKHTK